MSKIGTPRGFRDFGPEEMAGREYIFNIIKSVFRLYGYQPLETPAMELISTLTGKYGDEGDKLMFRILNSGDFLLEAREKGIDLTNTSELGKFIAEKGLRYDLTIPFARFVVEHYPELVFPFKRYQIQPVWRADRPQKGRYREFYQCDVDVIGSVSLLNEYELICIISDIFQQLNIDITIKLNHRKILYGMAEIIGETEKFIHLTNAIDKLEKSGLSAVLADLNEKGFSEDAVNQIMEILTLTSTDNLSKLEIISEKLQNTESGRHGVSDLKEIMNFCREGKKNIPLELDFRLARGLNYYTGSIIEVKAKNIDIGSICGGGRYDNLTGIFGLPGLSGVGVSFGADRIYDVMKNLNLFPATSGISPEVLILNFGQEEVLKAFEIQAELHSSGISAEIYPDNAKIKKQFSYASAKKIKYVLIAGKEEINRGIFGLKDLSVSQQYEMTLTEIAEFIRNKHV